jgi:hypothetical protein
MNLDNNINKSNLFLVEDTDIKRNEMFLMN